MARIRLTVEYDGSAYQGFQSQRSGRTVEDQLGKAVATLTGGAVKISGAGRTDSGVHACAQVVAFDFSGRLTPEKLKRGLNGLLPPDIAVVDVQECHADFDPRRHALARTYEYRILNRPERSAFLRGRAHHVPAQLDLQAMNVACASAIGVHDFRPFASESGEPVVRHVRECACWREGDMVFIRIRGNAFAKRMVRRLAGALIQIGLGRWAPQVMEHILYKRFDAPVAPSAPAGGLYLLGVEYAQTGRSPQLDSTLASTIELESHAT